MTRHVRELPPTPARSAAASPEELGSHAGVSFLRERLAPCLRELLPLIEKDWRECGSDHERIPLDIDLDRYLDYDLVGILQLVTARDAGLLVGYVLNFIHPHMMHRSSRWCMIDLYWLYPEYRGQGVGRALFEANEMFLRASGVKVIQASERVALRHALFQRCGFKEEGVVWRKILEG